MPQFFCNQLRVNEQLLYNFKSTLIVHRNKRDCISAARKLIYTTKFFNKRKEQKKNQSKIRLNASIILTPG